LKVLGERKPKMALTGNTELSIPEGGDIKFF